MVPGVSGFVLGVWKMSPESKMFCWKPAVIIPG
jgi:hypothetical protein